MYASPRSAAKHYRVSIPTMRRWAAEDRIEFKLTEGGHHRYLLSSAPRPTPRSSIIYARVSSAKQQRDLQRQIAHMRKRYRGYSVIKDVGGGANFKRKGLRSLLEQVCRGHVQTVAVYARDRLSRFGVDLIEYICALFDTEIIYDNDSDSDQPTELAEDLLTVITHFTARYYGARKYDSKEVRKGGDGKCSSDDT